MAQRQRIRADDYVNDYGDYDDEYGEYGDEDVQQAIAQSKKDKKKAEREKKKSKSSKQVWSYGHYIFDHYRVVNRVRNSGGDDQ